MHKYILRKGFIASLCISILILFISWQFLLSSLSILSNLFLIILFFISYSISSADRNKIILLIGFAIMLCIGYSFILQNENSLIFRFALIIFFVLWAYQIDTKYINCKFVFNILFIITFLLCIFLIISECFILFYFDDSIRKMIRNEVINLGIGDVYPSNFYYKIQLKGLSIILFVYLLSYVINIFPVSFKKMIRLIYIIGIIIAGNFAYLLALIFFHIVLYTIEFKKKKGNINRLFWGSIFVIFLISFFLPFASDVIASKKDNSNATRIDQATVLLKDLNENGFTLLMGKGLGNTVEVITPYRDYRNRIYYELQVIYFLNQLGVIPFLIFILTNIVFTFKTMHCIKIRIIYATYILYAVTNPYILDTNQVLVIILLLLAQQQSFNNQSYEKNYLRSSHL